MKTDKLEAKVSFEPTIEQLNEIEQWLIAEKKSTNQGFYWNWNNITKFFNDRNFAIISVNNKVIGFASWQRFNQPTANIAIVEIKPKYRKKGLGEVLVKQVLDFLKKDGVMTVDLECQPETSMPFWKKMGFIDAPPDVSSLQYSSTVVYKILVPSLATSNDAHHNELIELWDNEPIFTRNSEPKWKWKIVYSKTGRLKLPIIHPSESEWRIRWSKGNKVILDKKVKYFGESEIHFGTFMIIKKLPIKALS